MLAPVLVDAVDETFDAVPAQALMLMAGRSQAYANVDQKVAERIELRRPARVREPASAKGSLGELALSRPTGERHFGNEIVDSTEIVSRRCHLLHHYDPISVASCSSRLIAVAVLLINGLRERRERRDMELREAGRLNSGNYATLSTRPASDGKDRRTGS